MQYLYRPNECQMTFQETGARQVYVGRQDI